MGIKSLSHELGRRLREERERKGFSLSVLAARLGVTKGYLSRVESGKARPSAIMIRKIAKVLTIDPNPLSVLSGYLPTDLKEILYQYPEEAPLVLREAFAEYITVPKAMGYDAPQTRIAPDATDTIESEEISKGLYEVVCANCFDWMEQRQPNSIHAIVTDPPYGLKEYTSEEKDKLRRGRGGVWRIPPTFDGCTRNPLPRFTVLTEEDKAALGDFMGRWAKSVCRILVPGGHVFIATNPLVSHLVYMAIVRAGLEKRGEIIRLVQTLRGGDKPKNAHEEFSTVTVMPRSCWEPWGLFRKPCEGRVQDNLRKWKTGGLRRISEGQPFCDVIKSSPTRSPERSIAPHPSLKPQAFMRQIVRAALPLGEGIILDPFMGGGSTIAAACAIGYRSIGIESDPEFFQIAVKAIPKLATIAPNGESNSILPVRNLVSEERDLSLFMQHP